MSIKRRMEKINYGISIQSKLLHRGNSHNTYSPAHCEIWYFRLWWVCIKTGWLVHDIYKVTVIYGIIYVSKKGTTEDEMASPTQWTCVSKLRELVRQGSLVCYSPWSRKELDTPERLNWTDVSKNVIIIIVLAPPLGLWDLGSVATYWIWASAVGVQSPNHWASRGPRALCFSTCWDIHQTINCHLETAQDWHSLLIFFPLLAAWGLRCCVWAFSGCRERQL